jgi:hypothetical protein
VYNVRGVDSLRDTADTAPALRFQIEATKHYSCFSVQGIENRVKG